MPPTPPGAPKPGGLPQEDPAFRQMCRETNHGTEALGSFLDVDPERGPVMYVFQQPNAFSRSPQVIAVNPIALEIMVAHWLISKHGGQGAISTGTLTPPGAN